MNYILKVLKKLLKKFGINYLKLGKNLELYQLDWACRDSLRLEMGYCLYGNDIDQTTSPLEAGLGWITKLKKGEFIGRDVLMKQKENGIKNKLSSTNF